MSTPRCLLCHAYEMKPVQEFGVYRYFECDVCRTFTLHPLPTETTLTALYGSKDYYENEDSKSGYQDYESLKPGLIKTNFRRIKKSQRLKNKAAKILEIGSGPGSFAFALKDRGYENYQAVERNPYAVEMLQKAGFKATNTPIEQFQTDEKFDVIAFFDLIEHIMDPALFLRRVGKLLADKGELIFTTPSTFSWVREISGKNWVSFIVPDHVALYNPVSMQRLLAEAGFEVAQLTYDLQIVPLSFLFQRLGDIASPLKPFQKYVQNANVSFPVPNGNMLVYARKK